MVFAAADIYHVLRKRRLALTKLGFVLKLIIEADTKKLKLNNAAEYDLYEDLRIYDSGVTSASAYDNVQ